VDTLYNKFSDSLLYQKLFEDGDIGGQKSLVLKGLTNVQVIEGCDKQIQGVREEVPLLIEFLVGITLERGCFFLDSLYFGNY